jgi:hypothetical protein
MAIKNLDELGKYLNLEEGQKLSDLINSEDDVEVTLKEGDFYTSEQKESLIGNHRKEAETAGREKLLKELRDSNGLDYEGVKHPENFVNALQEKVKAEAIAEAKIEPSKKIDGLNNDLSQLRNQLQEKEGVINELNTKMKTERDSIKIEQAIFNSLPEKTSLPKDDLALLFRSKHDLRVGENGNIEILKGGEVLKDDMRNPIEVSKVVQEFSSSYIATPIGGSGNDNPPPSGGGDLESFTNEMKEKGVGINSEAFNKEMQIRIANGTLNM